MNCHVGPSGYSAFQWVHGQDYFTDPPLPPGLDPRLAMEGLLKARDQARVCFEKEKAKEKFSKLNNAKTRPPLNLKAGQLCMLWRQRVKPGKVKGSWVGPFRIVLVEGSTTWLVSGATLIRAKPNQIRAVSKREEMEALTEGTAVLRTPVTLSTLLQGFKGGHYLDVTGDVPSERQQADNITPADVSVEPAHQTRRADTWRLDQDGATRTLTRVHHLPRLALYAPTSSTPCPVPMDEFTGHRTTIVRPVLEGASEATINDTWDVGRLLPERWIGETRFELKDIPRPAKVRRGVPGQGTKRKAEIEEKPEVPPSLHDDGTDEKHETPPALRDDGRDQEATASEGAVGMEGLIPKTPLKMALERDPNLLDGAISKPKKKKDEHPQGASGSNSCPVEQCQLPGGHAGPHEGREGRFLLDESTGERMLVDDEGDNASSSATSSTSSDSELMPDEDHKVLYNKGENQPRQRTPKPSKEPTEVPVFYALELDVTTEEANWLMKHPRKAAIWLSKKMEAKGKEETWSKLSMDRKKDFDLAQAKELSQVLTSRALRSLTKSEEINLDKSAVMNMRWVLTTKSGGMAKARLVVLGFQAHNLTEVETASPTMSKVGRQMLLALTASLGFVLKSGDVSSAFLQTDASLESENLTVWATPELAALFGCDPCEPKALRVVRAFYGLCHAPRKWYESVVSTLKKQGWRQLLGDRCVFVLENEKSEIIGLAGFHVDDFLISGNPKVEQFIPRGSNVGK